MIDRTDDTVTLKLTVPATDARLDDLLAELSRKRLSIINSTLKTDYFFVESFLRRGDITTVTCSREALPYLEQALRAHRFTFSAQ